MTLIEIQQRLETSIKDSIVTMEGDGCNCSTKIIAPVFEGLSLLDRQKMVLAAVSEEIKNGTIHALSIKAYSPSENN